MKLLKKINNNFVLGTDAKGEKIIIEGKGIGFYKMPCELTDFKIITRTYYGYSDTYIDLLQNIPQEIIDVANSIYEYFISKVHCLVNPNLPFILADHINFAIARMTKNINVSFPMYYDLMQLYPIEYEVGEYAMKLINSKLHIVLPHNEISGIMLNLINSEANSKEYSDKKNIEIYIKEIISIIEENMDVTIDENSFNYARFVSHVEYLLKRIDEKVEISSDNKYIYKTLNEQFPKTSKCVDKISIYLESNEGSCLSEEEKLYLILHVNRLCERALGL